MKIALLQMQSGIDPHQNGAIIAAAIAEAAQNGAAMIFTPEMCGLLDSKRDRARHHITNESSDLVLRDIRLAALTHKIWVHVGSLAIDDGRADGRLSNRTFIIDSDGVIRARYDKMHLFDVDLPAGESWRESAAYVPGEGGVVVATPLGILGLSICYDLRFPALFAALSAAGATILAIPAAFTAPTGEAHWHILLRARAIENAAYVIAAAQYGHHDDGRKTYGHSLVIDPWGQVILEMTELGLGYAEIDDDLVKSVRARIPVINHRRDIQAVLTL
jgi:deaminated glutathione amidase